MSIQTLRESLADIPGSNTLTMRYEPETGKQIFKIGETEATVAGCASDEEIRKALMDAISGVPDAS